jgi:outer membrane lipoprotein
MKYYLLSACIFLSACTSLPKEITDPPSYDLTYIEAVSKVPKFKNAPVRWGGTIVEVENEPDFSAIQILLYPLGYHGRPDLDEPSQGRFVMKTPSFLDPAAYKKNSSITVSGILEGQTERMIGNKTLNLPLIAAKQFHLWQDEDYYNSYGGYGGFGFGSGFYPYGGFYGSPYYWGGGPSYRFRR